MLRLVVVFFCAGYVEIVAVCQWRGRPLREDGKVEHVGEAEVLGRLDLPV